MKEREMCLTMWFAMESIQYNSSEGKQTFRHSLTKFRCMYKQIGRQTNAIKKTL
jgi:hypothetical protein